MIVRARCRVFPGCFSALLASAPLLNHSNAVAPRHPPADEQVEAATPRRVARDGLLRSVGEEKAGLRYAGNDDVLYSLELVCVGGNVREEVAARFVPAPPD